MPIVSSTTEDVAQQADGRSYVRERHTDHVGVDHVRIWLADRDADLNAALMDYAAALPETLKQAEIQRNIDRIKSDGSLARPDVTNVHATDIESEDALRAFYKTSSGSEAIMTGDYLNGASDQKIGRAFGLSQAEAAQLKAQKFHPQAQQAETLRTATGV